MLSTPSYDAQSEVVAEFEHDGKTYQIDHLGVSRPDSQWGEYVIYCDEVMIGDFDHGANLKPDYRPVEPTADELIAMAKQRLATLGPDR